MLTALFLFLACFTNSFAYEGHYNEELRCAWNCYRKYEGLLSTTVTGKYCRYWKSGDITTKGRFQISLMHNQCRTANLKHMPWCYIEGENQTDWEYCFHFHCRNFPEFQNSVAETNLCRKPGFYQFEGKCYTVLPTQTRSRADAILACQNHSSELLSIKSEKEAAFINSLTCVPKMLSAKYRRGKWKWLDKNNSWNLNKDKSHWCAGEYYEQLSGNCTALMGMNCLAKMDCLDPFETLFPACVYTPKPTEMVETQEFVTWENATEVCESNDRRLCLLEDLCKLPSSDKLLSAKYKSLALPLTGDQWVPLGDEYNNWVYAGEIDPDKYCKVYNDHYGPPLWGLDSSICMGNNDNCQNIGKIICCENGSKSSQKEVQEVHVHIESKEEDGVFLYRFSKNENKTNTDVEEDQAMWRKYGRQYNDLRSFKLMSGYVKGCAENPVYFCVRNYSFKSSIPTQRHLISLQPCSSGWSLNFYLYAMREIPKNKAGKFINLVIETSDNNTQSHSRIFVKQPDMDISTPKEFLDIFTSVIDGLVEALPFQDPCSGGVQKVKDNHGVIFTPDFPLIYPKKTPALECRWKIAAEKSHLLKIKFTSIKLKDDRDDNYFSQVKVFERFRANHGQILFNHNQTCNHERVEISDAQGRQTEKNPNWLYYGTFCGTWSPDSFISTDNAISVRFYGARKRRGQGFSLIFEAVSPPRGLVQIKLEESERARMTWRSARSLCHTKSKSLCTVEDICGIGRPFYGVERGNHWAPVLDEFNDWVQIGEEKGQTCERHNKLYGPPQWGVMKGNCDTSNNTHDCSQKSFIYCCDFWNPRPEQVLNDETLPVARDVNIKVYTAYQNGMTYYRYIREDQDDPDDMELWSFTRKHLGDVTRMKLYSNYKRGFDKVVYFCFKPLVLPLGELKIVYSMFSEPCHRNDWRLSFYLYASSRKEPAHNTKKIYIGISNLTPHHSRAHFHRFPHMFLNVNGFIIFVESPDFVPESLGQNAIPSEPYIDKCSKTPVSIEAPSVLVSPGYPKGYGKNMDCIWRIKLSKEHRDQGVKLKILIEELHLEDQADYLLVYEAPLNITLSDLSHRDAKEYSGIVRHVSHITEKSFILHFKSDYSIQKPGFKINIKIINDKCGGILKNHGATVTSMNYPENYTGGLNCTWTIKAPNAGYGIEVQFSKLEVKYSNNCTDDYVTMGPPSDEERFEYCGVLNIPPREQFNESTIEIRFISAKGKPIHKGFVFNVFFWAVGSFSSVGSSVSKCGLQEIQPWGSAVEPALARVVGGTQAVPGSWPWVVYLKEAACGGTLLNSKWVVSAGHCFAEKKSKKEDWGLIEDFSNYSVVAGRHHRTSQSSNEQVFRVENIILHPQYDRVTVGNAGTTMAFGIPINDIALVKLKQTAIFTDTVSPICLTTQDVTAGETCVIAGWGSRDILASLSGDTDDTLHYALVHVLGNSVCNSYNALRGSLRHSMTCAGYPGGGVDSCRGDSGGPLMCKGPDQRYQIKGVVSWGKGCGRPNQPGIYTRVFSYYDWISSIIYT